jgi:hypothetical protein
MDEAEKTTAGIGINLPRARSHVPGCGRWHKGELDARNYWLAAEAYWLSVAENLK